MGKPTKTVSAKLTTQLAKIGKDHPELEVTSDKVKIRNKILFEYSSNVIKYKKIRYYVTKKIDIEKEDLLVNIFLSHESLKILSSSLINPPSGIYVLTSLIKKYSKINLTSISIGVSNNNLDYNTKTLEITTDLYQKILSISSEENKNKQSIFENRVLPIINESFQTDFEVDETSRDYGLLLEELLAAEQIPKESIIKLCSRLEDFDTNRIVVENQINKQAEWLINCIQKVIDDMDLNTAKAKKYAKELFHIPSIEISGPEQFMEKILTRYGKTVIFGVPALLNTDKYINNDRLSRSQIDLILINHLSDLEIVELKRPNTRILEFDPTRKKFYASKDLSIAISQSERYISAIYRENDNNFTINGKPIKQYLNEQLGGDIEIDICRPSALIIIGTFQTLCKPYEQHSKEFKQRMNKEYYNFNAMTAYKELKTAHKNIIILTYSELLENARVRLKNNQN